MLVLALALQAFALASPFFMQWVVDGAVVSADRVIVLQNGRVVQDLRRPQATAAALGQSERLAVPAAA